MENERKIEEIKEIEFRSKDDYGIVTVTASRDVAGELTERVFATLGSRVVMATLFEKTFDHDNPDAHVAAFGTREAIEAVKALDDGKELEARLDGGEVMSVARGALHFVKEDEVRFVIAMDADGAKRLVKELERLRGER